MSAQPSRSRVGLAALALGGCLATAPGRAEEPAAIPVVAGTCRLLPVAYVDLDRNCASRGRPEIVVERAPRLGALLVDEKRLRFASPGFGPARCVGRRVPNTVLYYQAGRDSRGRDEFTFVATGKSGRSQRVTWRIDVLPPVAGAPSCRG